MSIENLIPDTEAGHLRSAAIGLYDLVCDMNRPSRILKVRVIRDGNAWCCIFGDNLHDGVAGFGDSPEEATKEFDKEWVKKIK
jgi:hypothetical protein